MRLSDLQTKKIVDMNDGRNMGNIIDVNVLENGNIDLDNAIKKYTEAMELSKFCSEKLKDATDKVNKILTENGELKDFDVDKS